jgi:hypothetical protein
VGLHCRGRGEGRCHQRGGVLNIKGFFVDALTSALELGIGTPDDVVRHVTPEVLAKHLPRPLWARLFTACLGAPRVDAALVVDTIGVPNFCEHVPASIIWACLAEIGARALGKVPDITVAPAPLPRSTSVSGGVRASVLAPPPEERPSPPPVVSATPVAIGPSIPSPAPTPAADQPLADLITELEQDGGSEPRLATLRPRSPTAQRFRQSNTGIQRLGTARRPQAVAAATPAPITNGRPRREPTEADPDIVTNAGDPNRSDIAVDDSQLVDWQATDGAGAPAVTDDDFSDLGRKR